MSRKGYVDFAWIQISLRKLVGVVAQHALGTLVGTEQHTGRKEAPCISPGISDDVIVNM